MQDRGRTYGAGSRAYAHQDTAKIFGGGDNWIYKREECDSGSKAVWGKEGNNVAVFIRWGRVKVNKVEINHLERLRNEIGIPLESDDAEVLREVS